MKPIIYWDCESYWGMYPLIKDPDHFKDINFIYNKLFEIHKNNTEIDLYIAVVGILLCKNEIEQSKFLYEILSLNEEYRDKKYNNRIKSLINVIPKLQKIHIKEEIELLSKLENVKVGNHTSTHPYIKMDSKNFNKIMLNEIKLTENKIKQNLGINPEFLILPQNKLNDTLALDLINKGYKFRPSNIIWEYDENLESNGSFFKSLQRLKRLVNMFIPKLMRVEPRKYDGTISNLCECGIFLKLPSNKLEFLIFLNFYKYILGNSKNRILWLHPHNFISKTELKIKFYLKIIEIITE